VVVNLDEPSKDRANQVFRNIKNLLDGLGENNNVEVDFIANSGGVKALVKGLDSHVAQGRVIPRQGSSLCCLRAFLEPVGNRQGCTFDKE